MKSTKKSEIKGKFYLRRSFASEVSGKDWDLIKPSLAVVAMLGMIGEMK